MNRSLVVGQRHSNLCKFCRDIDLGRHGCIANILSRLDRGNCAVDVLAIGVGRRHVRHLNVSKAILSFGGSPRSFKRDNSADFIAGLQSLQVACVWNTSDRNLFLISSGSDFDNFGVADALSAWGDPAAAAFFVEEWCLVRALNVWIACALASFKDEMFLASIVARFSALVRASVPVEVRGCCRGRNLRLVTFTSAGLRIEVRLLCWASNLRLVANVRACFRVEVRFGFILGDTSLLANVRASDVVEVRIVMRNFYLGFVALILAGGGVEVGTIDVSRNL